MSSSLSCQYKAFVDFALKKQATSSTSKCKTEFGFLDLLRHIHYPDLLGFFCKELLLVKQIL